MRSAVELANELAEKAKARRQAAEKNELGLEGPAQVDAGTPGPVSSISTAIISTPPLPFSGQA